jgi:hypothetical protein
MIMKWQQNNARNSVSCEKQGASGNNWQHCCCQVKISLSLMNSPTGNSGNKSLLNIYIYLSLSLSLSFSLSLSRKVLPLLPVGLFRNSIKSLRWQHLKNRVLPVVASWSKHKQNACFAITKGGENDLV